MNWYSTLKTQIPQPIRLFTELYGTGLLFFSFFRLVMLITERERIGQAQFSEILESLLMGIRFDLVISGYILALPFVILSVFYFLKHTPALLYQIIKFYLLILFSLAYLVCAVDLPYFNHFFSRFTIMAFQWIDNPEFVLGMILQEPRYWIAVIPFIVSVYLYSKSINTLFKHQPNHFPNFKFKNLGLIILFAGLIFAGIRGRFDEKTPINVGTAYFGNHAFLNQLGLNPNFTLIRSYIESKRDENKPIQLMDNAEALQFAQEQLGITTNDSLQPLSRIITPNTPAKPFNVVLVIMESMSAAKLKRHGDTHNLTPFFNQLTYQGIYFENTYTSGIHTFNGIFSSLFSYPALFKKHPMKSSIIPKYHGLATSLKQNGYQTTYFTTHDGQFDNVEGFLKANDFDQVISKKDYPSEQIKTTLGVPDDYMFEFSIPILNQLHQNKKPFFTAFMTASDHGPYYIPPYFKPKNQTDIKKKIVEYADFSLQKFLSLAKKQPWFNETIFVFVADHGAAMDVTYDMSLDYNHSPLLFYAPSILKPQTHSQMAGQIDLYPTLLGLLNLPYQNNTLGIDLLKTNRPYIFCGADDKYGVVDQEWFLIVHQTGNISLHKYRSKDKTNYASQFPDKVSEMKKYAEAHLQTYQYVLQKDLTK